jgi:hypothetical protein
MRYYQVYREYRDGSGDMQLLATVWASSCNSACNRVIAEQELGQYANLCTIEYEKRNNFDVVVEYPDRRM